MIPLPPESTLFPYTTLFRSCNWIQAMENSVDPAHNQILHQRITYSGIYADGSLGPVDDEPLVPTKDRKSTRLNSSHRCISYAVFCLKKKKKTKKRIL